MTQLDIDAEIFHRVTVSRIQLLRKAKRMSEKVMAATLGVTQSAYSRMESGDTGITIETLFKIARILDSKVNDLIQ